MLDLPKYRKKRDGGRGRGTKIGLNSFLPNTIKNIPQKYFEHKHKTTVGIILTTFKSVNISNIFLYISSKLNINNQKKKKKNVFDKFNTNNKLHE